MTKKQLNDFIIFLKKDWQTFGPQKIKGGVLIERLDEPDSLILNGQPPFYPFKKFFLSGCEDIFQYQAERLKKQNKETKVALLGMDILDLESVLLYDLVFKDDPYYHQKRKNILIVAKDAVPRRKNNFFGKKFSPSLLKNLPYDIFLIKNGSQKYKVVAGSPLGKKTLNNFGYKPYIENTSRYGSPKLSTKQKEIQRRFAESAGSKLWKELGMLCLECGKCTLVCPTCFCFRIDDQPSLEKNKGKRSRCWDSCFYHNFSQVGGGYKFLKNTEERIRFWYEHKFLRIPREFGMLGCVGCGRCTTACPAGIDIKKNLKKIIKQN